MIVSKSGSARGCFPTCGGLACWSSISAWAWTGDGRAWTGPWSKRPWGGKSTGPNATDRAKSGTKRSVLTEGHGLPVGLVIDGANRHDMKLLEPTLQAKILPGPQVSDDNSPQQNLCLDAGYDYAAVRQTLQQWGYTAHIVSRGQEKADKQQVPGYRARRWVVKRTHSWMNRYRRLLIRWEKKPENYLALLHLACACICFRTAWVSG